MEARVKFVTRKKVAPAVVAELVNRAGKRICRLDLDHTKLADLPAGNPYAADFLLLSLAVYALDRLFLRETSRDGWARQFTLLLPVSNVSIWASIENEINRCLSFLTGDHWSVRFSRRPASAAGWNGIRPDYGERASPSAKAVCLFSGGLDSLVGVIDWLETNRRGHLILLGHHDGEIAGPLSDQKRLLHVLNEFYGRRINPVLLGAGQRESRSREREPTTRSRSFLFIGLAIYVASAGGTFIPVFIPENGTIALNVPLTPSRRGACSTRTAHPYFLGQLSQILVRLGLPIRLLNPLELKTKGEAILQCANTSVLRKAVPQSVSCAKRGHRMHFTRREAMSCGRCMPCIYRRAALHAAGWDDEKYGDDVCKGDVAANEEGEKASDLRACVAFLRSRLTPASISAALMASGSLDPAKLAQYAAVVERAMTEIKALFKDKGTERLRKLAGLRSRRA